MFQIIKAKPTKSVILGGVGLFFCLTLSYAQTGQIKEIPASEVALQADLSVQEIKFYLRGAPEWPENEVEPVKGRPLVCKATLKNIGNAPTGIFNVKWFVDGIQRGYGSHESLPPGVTSNGNVRFTWIPATAGTHTISFIADSNNHIRESDEGNNTFKRTVSVIIAVQALPDLAVEGIKFYRPYSQEQPENEIIPTAGRPLVCKATFKNIGNAPTGIFNVKWFVDGIQRGYGSHESLPSGVTSNGNVRFTWVPTAGTHTLSFIADPDNHTAESNEDNNRLNLTIDVQPDIIPPTGRIKINNDSQYTNSIAVVLDISSQDGPGGSGFSQVSLSNDAITWSPPEAYALTKYWQLLGGDGIKTVYVKFKDLAANWSNPISDSIILDTTAPVTTPSGIDGSWHNRPVTVTLTASEAGSTTYYSYHGEDPQTLYNGPFIISGEGIFTLKYYSEDKAGNQEAVKTAEQEIKIDKSPPAIQINPPDSPTNRNVILSYAVTDNLTPAAEIEVSGDRSPYTEEGNFRVSLAAKDKANNTSTASLSFTIDKTPPVIVITSPSNGAVFDSSQIFLSGTVDKVPFSEGRTLTNEGENLLTKEAEDSAGNRSFASVTVHLYLGRSIGPEGGQITSGDGRLKLIVPAGALNESKRINILPINKGDFHGTAPAGRALLGIAECKPYGLVFNKPVSLIYTLPQAEVPGTSVELGLYDRIQDKITPTGQTAMVPLDGYTVNFSLMHFSTYAALGASATQNIPMGGGVKIPLPDMFTGAFSHSIPITVPPGRKGLQPSLALAYRSSTPNSWVGLGFSLNPGYIVRSTKLGPPTYNDTQDTFYFVSDAGTTELAHLIDNLYQARIESGFTKFFKETDDSWRVVAKDGSILRFGQTADAKEGSSLGTFSWYLTKAQDTNGNYIEYNYTKDQGKSYLQRIDYTGNENTGVSPTNSVEFSLEARDDIPSSYISGVKVATAKRLKEIQAKVNSQLVWRYELEYALSPDTNRSLLKSVKQYTSDDKPLPTQAMEYQGK